MFPLLTVAAAILSIINCARADIYAECNSDEDGSLPVRIFVASATSCSRYIFCDGDSSYDGECGDDDYFNEIYQTCDHKDLVECRFDIKTEEVANESPNNNAPIISPGTISNDNNSSSISTTTNGGGIVAPPVVNMPEAVIDTSSDNTTTTETLSVNNSSVNTNVTNPVVTNPSITNPVSTNPSIVSTPLLLTECPAVDNPLNMVFLSHPKSCSDYFICYHGEAIPMHCSSMLHFNTKSGKCDYPENAKCRTDFTRDQCTSHTVDLYPHSSNCNYFYYCKNGYLLLQQCPFFFGWDYERRSCIALSQAKCFNNIQKRL